MFGWLTSNVTGGVNCQTGGKHMMKQSEKNIDDEVRVEEFERRLAAALRRILQSEKMMTKSNQNGETNEKNN